MAARGEQYNQPAAPSFNLDFGSELLLLRRPQQVRRGRFVEPISTALRSAELGPFHPIQQGPI